MMTCTESKHSWRNLHYPCFLAAFHCHQAAEKMAKAVLIASNVAPPRIHDIARLGRLVAEQHAEIGAAITHLGRLSTWYVSARYPEDPFDLAPSEQDIRKALTELQLVRQRINSLAPKA